MKKLLLLFVLPVFFSPMSLDSGEMGIFLTSGQRYQLSADVGTRYSYFEQVPQNPNLFQETPAYTDSQLKTTAGWLKPNENLSIKRLTINEQAIPVFELTDGSYLPASKWLIFDDVVFDNENFTQTYWTKEKPTVYTAPYVLGVTSKDTVIEAYSPVSVISRARTQHGVFLEIENKGWVRADDLSEIDTRIDKVQKLLNQKYNKSNYGIYVKQLATQATASINPDQRMYSASIAKLPLLYYVEEQLANGSLALSDKLTYIEQVNQFSGSYDVSGSSKMSLTADDKDYSIDELTRYVSQNSDNVASNLLGYYVANQYDKTYQTTIENLAGGSWNMTEKQMSAKMAGKIMEKLYYQNSQILTYLSETDFDNQRISKDISARVAHKIGDAYDYKHDVALVYADSPFILSIFTDKSSYDEITTIANDVYEILK
ncbi:serine hydrolase [Streptococcus sp. sy018]|uniref:serine hydrolase n=1 Tax=Streptococcus sp. sy018 TaxID=2600147 RepID=UPI0011B621FA|nr:serine hydrolase [Streptococcus sp. sy018]TWS94520.1 serine hydrolase [Streptococcus sp. sy018]